MTAYEHSHLFCSIVVVHTNFEIITAHNHPLLSLNKLTRTNRSAGDVPLADHVSGVVIPNIQLAGEEGSQNPGLCRVHVYTLHSFGVIH